MTRQVFGDQAIVLPGQLGIAGGQRPAQLGGVEQQAVVMGGEVHRRAEVLAPRTRIGRRGAAQVDLQRGEGRTAHVAQQLAHRAEEVVHPFRGDLRLLVDHLHAHAEAVVVALGFQGQIGAVVEQGGEAHHALERLVQRGAGPQRKTQGVEGGRADEARRMQADVRVAGARHRQRPEAPGQRRGKARLLHVLVGQVGTRLQQQLVGVVPQRLQRARHRGQPAGHHR
ncbi:hypothetical protein D3C80_1357880 [compost metagenome]